MDWVLVSYRLPTDQSRARVAVWREVRRIGALPLQQALVAFPDVDQLRPAIERFRTLVSELGGQAIAVRGTAFGAGDAERLAAMWEEARAAEYGELTAEGQKFLAEIEHEFEIEKFTLAELEEEESQLERLERWHERIKGRDVLGSEAAASAKAGLEEARRALTRYSAAVFERTAP
jgi:hypothetical protein